MEEVLGRSDREQFGLLGGEVLECQYVRARGLWSETDTTGWDG